MPDHARLSVVPMLADILADPAMGLDLAPREAAALLLTLAPVLKALELAAARGHGGASANSHNGEMLTAAEVASRLGLTVKQVYRRAGRWPFTRRLSERTLGFDRHGFDLYMGRAL